MSTAIAIIFSKDRHQVLVLQRCDVPIWVLPGGGIDQGESPEEAAIREVFEETGLHVIIKRKIAEYSPINRLTLRTHVFECEASDGKGGLSIGSETRNIGFYPINKLPIPFFPVHGAWLKDALKNESFVIKRPISEVTYRELFKYFIRHPWWVIRFALTRLGFCRTHI